MALGIGVELGPSAVRGVVLEPAGKRVKLVAAHELPCETANPAALTPALTQLRRLLRTGGAVVLGVPSSSTILTTVSPLVANPRRADLAVQFELQQQLPFQVSDAAWHHHWLIEGNGAATKFGVRNSEFGVGTPHSALRTPHLNGAVVAAMRRSLLDERLACCQRAGFSVHAVAVNAVAILNAWNLERADATGKSAALLHLQDPQTAEWIAWASGALHVFPVISPSADAFWQELAASWEALRAQLGSGPDQVWVVAPADMLLRVQGSLAGASSVQLFDVGRLVAGGNPPGHPERYAAAIGLALQGLGQGRVTLNLLASVQHEAQGRQVQRTAAVVSGVLALASLGLGVSGMVEVRQRKAQLLQSLDRQQQLYQTLRPDVRALIQQQERVQQRSRKLQQLVQEAPALTTLLAEVTDVLPDNVWLTALECSKTGLIDGSLEGRAKSFPDVTQFLDRLKSAAGMTTVKPLSTNVITDPTTQQEVVAFAVQIQRPLTPPPTPALSEDSGGLVGGQAAKASEADRSSGARSKSGVKKKPGATKKVSR